MTDRVKIDVATMTPVEFSILVASVGVLIGLFQGHKGWGRWLAFWSLIVVGALCVVFAPELFPSFF